MTSLESGKSYRVSIRAPKLANPIARAPTSRPITWAHASIFCTSRPSYPRSSAPLNSPNPTSAKVSPWRWIYRDPLGLPIQLADKLPDEVETIVAKYRDQTIADVATGVKVVRHWNALVQASKFIRMPRVYSATVLASAIDETGSEIRLAPEKASASQAVVKGRALAVPVGWHRLRRRALVVRCLADEWASAKRSKASALPNSLPDWLAFNGVDCVPRVAQEPMGRRDQPLLQSQSSHRIGQRLRSASSNTVISSLRSRITNRLSATNRSSRRSTGLDHLDEGQRIKNWESKTSRTFKSLKSRFCSRPVGYFAREPARRTLHGGEFRELAFAGAAYSLLPQVSQSR